MLFDRELALKFITKQVPWLLALCLSSPVWSAVSEHELKAAFIEKFTHFIEWPNDAKEKFHLCVIGKNLFKGELKKMESLAINGKPTLFTQMIHIDSVINCDVLFIEKTTKNTLKKILYSLKDRSVLTIADTPGYAHNGVIINFVRKSNKLHFEINRQAAEITGLKISSRLLKLATIIFSSTPHNNDTEIQVKP